MKDGTITGQVIAPDVLLKNDQETWREFLAHRPSAFLSFPYVRAVASCVPLVRICRIIKEGQTVAFFPFQYRSAIYAAAGIGERLGGELSDYFGPVSAPGFRIDAKKLLQISGLKSLRFTNLDESQRQFGLVGEKPDVGHRIDFPKGGDAFWEERVRIDKKFTSDTERRERKLIREYGPLRFVFSERDPAHSLSEIISRKRAQYRRTGVIDVLSEKRARDILHALCETRDDQCSGVISTLYAGDTWVASHFGLQCGSILHYWFPVYNPVLKTFAPGRILLKQIISGAQTNGLTRIDRGAGDSVAKRDFATSQHLFYSGLWQRASMAALGHRVWLAAGWRVSRYLHLPREF